MLHSGRIETASLAGMLCWTGLPCHPCQKEIGEKCKHFCKKITVL